jgi:hypothetical protein
VTVGEGAFVLLEERQAIEEMAHRDLRLDQTLASERRKATATAMATARGSGGELGQETAIEHLWGNEQ